MIGKGEASSNSLSGDVQYSFGESRGRGDKNLPLRSIQEKFLDNKKNVFFMDMERTNSRID